MDMRKLVGRNVKRIRLEKGLTQEQFAERSGFTQQYLSGLEQGKRNPTILSLYELALALDVDQVALVAPDEAAMEEEARRRAPSNGDVKAGGARIKRGKAKAAPSPSDGRAPQKTKNAVTS
jgi:transcriptional regulator with XRE-family HTH domain